MRSFVGDLSLVLVVAAVAGLVCRGAGLPTVVGYLLAGIVVGPHFPVPLFVDVERIHGLADLGVVLVMFSIGLEFTLRKLRSVGTAALGVALIEIGLAAWLGSQVAGLVGLSGSAGLLMGGVVAISSTTVISGLFRERGMRGRVADLVFGVLVIEDVVAIFLLAIFNAMASGQALEADGLVRTGGRLGLFLVAVLLGGYFVVPRLVRAVARSRFADALLMTSMGLCFGLALLADSMGFSLALGAFVAGALVAESGVVHQVERLVAPLRDVFAAVFFVSIGMLVEPGVVVDQWVTVAMLTAIVLLAKPLGVSAGAFLAGHDVRTAVQAGLSMGQIGEFSLILASAGAALAGPELLPIVGAVTVITAFASSALVAWSQEVAALVDRQLPKRLQTFATLYASWLEGLRESMAGTHESARMRRQVRGLLVDTAMLSAIVIATSQAVAGETGWLSARLGLNDELTALAIGVVGILMALPFGMGIFRLAGQLGTTLAFLAMPQVRSGSLDLAAAPRRMLLVTLRMGVVVAAALPVLALTQPFLPTAVSLSVAVPLLALLGVGFWRSATNLQGHVSAGAEAILQVLERQLAQQHTPVLDATNQLLPGLGQPTPVVLPANSPVIGKTLAELQLRATTGAQVLAITHTDGGVAVPDGSELLAEGDVLAVAGSADAVSTAAAILEGRGRRSRDG